MSQRALGGRTGAMLLRAIARNEVATVERLLARRGQALLSVHGPDGCTPLLLACKKGHLEMVRLLMSHGAKISDRDCDAKRQGNALHYACWGGSLDVVHFLLQQGASTAETDVVGNTPLLYAVYGGHRHIVEDLLRRGRSLREKNNKNHTVILQAACGGHLELVEWLLQKGFSLQETDNDGNTALLFAAWGGHRELMEFLLRNGSSLQEKNQNGHSVFLSAANGGRVEIVEWLLSQEGFDLHETNHNGDTALLLAAYGGHRRLVERLLELGANFDDHNGCGFSALLSAANGGQLEMASWLLSKGASLAEADNDGYTSLILAACGGNIDLVDFFLKRGASLTERNHNGDTALLLAAYCGHRDLVEWLLNHGSQLTERNNTNMGVLISAANGGHLDVVRLLVERYNAFGIEDKDDGGYTPLLLAAQRGHMHVVQYLAAYGANVKARTTRHDNDAIALAMDNPEVQEYLREIWDFSPLQIACDARLVDRVHALLQTGVDPVHGYAANCRPLQLASRALAYPGARPPCADLLRLLQAAAQPWSPRTHLLYGERFRNHIFQTLKLSLLLRRAGALPVLPHEIWLHIMSFNERRSFPEIVDPENSWLDNPALVAQRARYRNGRLARRALPLEEPATLSDLDLDDDLASELEDMDSLQRAGLRNTASDRATSPASSVEAMSVEAPTDASDHTDDSWRGKLLDISEDDLMVADHQRHFTAAATAASAGGSPFQYHVTWV